MSRSELVRTYEPVLLFSTDGEGRSEAFLPMAADHFVARSRLYRDGKRLPDPPGGWSLDGLAGVPSGGDGEHYLAYALDRVFEPAGESGCWTGAASDLDEPGEAPSAPWDPDDLARSRRLPKAVRAKVLDLYEPYRDLDRHPPPYYFRVSDDGGHVVIQYWMFYAYNDWGLAHGGLNDHEGDWEAVFVFLKHGEPAYVAYSAHARAPALYEWRSDAFERRFETHPVVYVACGSHAAYAAPGAYEMVIRDRWRFTDHANGESRDAIGPGARWTWGAPVDLDRAPWARRYAGHWGALVNRLGPRAMGRGSHGPVGPAFQTAKWESPVEWAGVPSPGD